MTATTAGVEYIDKDAEPILLSSDEESDAPLEIGPMDLPKLREVVRLHKELITKINGLPMQNSSRAPKTKSALHAGYQTSNCSMGTRSC